MAEFKGVTIPITVGVDRNTAELALKVVEKYCNDNYLRVGAIMDKDADSLNMFLQSRREQIITEDNQ